MRMISKIRLAAIIMISHLYDFLYVLAASVKWLVAARVLSAAVVMVVSTFNSFSPCSLVSTLIYLAI